jgi:hypothetical protein
MLLIIIMFAILYVITSCHKKCKNDVHPLIQCYCPNGPNSCTSELITVEGYLDGFNIMDDVFCLYSKLGGSGNNENCLNDQFIEVYYPETDLSTIFSKSGPEYYRPGFDVKVVVNNAKIEVWSRENPGNDDGNKLIVDSIQQIDFYKIENDGQLTHLTP